MRHVPCTIVAVVVLSICATWAQHNENQYYAGQDNPLVRLGAQRVLKAISYPDWFLWPAMSKDVRQQLVDSYTTREFLLSFDQSAKNAPATKYNDAGQLILDLWSAYGGRNGSLTPSPTPKEINQTLKEKVVPALVKPREGYQFDSPSANETVAGKADYSGPNGEDIQNLDRYIAGLARHYSIPTGYNPPSRPVASEPAKPVQSCNETIRSALVQRDSCSRPCGGLPGSLRDIQNCQAKCNAAAKRSITAAGCTVDPNLF